MAHLTKKTMRMSGGNSTKRLEESKQKEVYGKQLVAAHVNAHFQVKTKQMKDQFKFNIVGNGTRI